MATVSSLASSTRPRIGRALLAGLVSSVLGDVAGVVAWLGLGANPSTPQAALGPFPSLPRPYSST